MAIAPFHRGSTWSSSLAFERIASKRSAAEKRLAEITKSVSALEMEKIQLLHLLVQLDTARGDEEVRVASRSGSRRSRPVEGSPGGSAADGGPTGEPENVPTSPASAPVVRSAAQTGPAAPYDAERCLFVTSQGPASGSTRPKRIDVTRSGFDDPLIRRAVKMLETPGLIHEMIVAERSQVVVPVDVPRVPDDALGLPLAGHIFSLDALKALSEPETASGFLAKIMADDPGSEPS